MGSISTLNGTSLWRLYYSALIFGLSPQHWHGGEGVPKCVTFDVHSILGVQFSSENFSLCTDPVGLNIFAKSANRKIAVFGNFEAPWSSYVRRPAYGDTSIL